MIIITNFKTYKTAIGDEAVCLAQLHEEAAQETGTQFAIAASALDLENVINSCENLPVFAQHIDAAGFGSFTGKIPAQQVANMGVTGTILNHSENRLDKAYLAECVAAAQEAGLKVVVCAETVEEGVEFMSMKPDFIAVEPPELIGGDISVSTANPGIIKDAVEQIGAGKVIVGAGVKNAEDVRIAKELGASGILLASGVTKAENPKAVLLDLAKGAK
jgi:triosephosphate isomerase